MGTDEPENMDEVILNYISAHTDGISLNQLLDSLAHEIPRRTLQRHLSILKEKGKIIQQGGGRSTKYLILETQKPTYEKAADEIPLSDESMKVRDKIRAPLHLRSPVGYQHTFLDAYKPNATYYLSTSERKHLKEIGMQDDGNKPAGTFARKILDRFLIDLSWNSSRLEGNTYSLLETEKLINEGDSPSGKSKIETRMILNHKAAIEFLVESGYDIDVNLFTICNLHAILADNLLSNPQAYGRVRTIPVAIGKSVYQPIAMPQIIEEYLLQILLKASAIEDPFEQALFLLVQLPYLQPFEDVNKRVSRLCANIPFIKRNYCPISFVDLPQKNYFDAVLSVYELNEVTIMKDVFLWAYERSTNRYAAIRQEIGEPDQFRLRYHNLLYELVNLIVSSAMSKDAAIKTIRTKADQVPMHDQGRFVELVETELLSLHERNFARYRVTPQQFEDWKNGW